MSLLTSTSCSSLRFATARVGSRGVRWLQCAAAPVGVSTGPAFAFDIDGVLKQGAHVLPQAKEALQILSGNNPLKRKFPFILVTNGGGTIEGARAQKLSSELGIHIAEHQIVQSHTVFRSLAARYADKPVLVIGGPDDSCRQVAEHYGFQHAFIPADLLAWQRSQWPFNRLTEEELSYIKTKDFSSTCFAAILVFHDSRDWGRDIQLCLDVVRSVDGVLGTAKDLTNDALWTREAQVPIYFSNPDLLWGNEWPQPRFGQGALQESMAAVFKMTTGRELHRSTGGKPSRRTYEYSSSLLHSAIDVAAHGGEVDFGGKGGSGSYKGRVYMVGDNPRSDIAGANAFGWESILVRTGVFRGGENDPEHRATVVVPDVLEAVKWALRREGEIVA